MLKITVYVKRERIYEFQNWLCHVGWSLDRSNFLGYVSIMDLINIFVSKCKQYLLHH